MIKELAQPLICVVGPTASGKSALAQAIAEELKGEVLSADSMQIYKGMDIGTGKVPVAQRTVAYHGLDLVEPGEPYSAALYQTYGRRVIEQCEERGIRPIVCGGTGFYVKALVDDMNFPPGEQVDNPVRDNYRQQLEEEGAAAIWEKLNELDPASAEIIEPNDAKRVIRALELHAEGVSYFDQKERFAQIKPYYPTIMLGIAVEPEVLARRINERVDTMVEAGLVDEVKGLLAQGYEKAVTANQAIGYKEIVDYLRGACTLEDAVERVKTATRQYAKRQRTWFRKVDSLHWLDEAALGTEGLLPAALTYIGEGA